MKLSVIIPCFNSVRTIGAQLDAFVAQDWSEPWELIVADNGSTDGSVLVVKAYRERLPRLRIVDASARRGPGYARNVGVNAAAGDAVAFCDADDVVGAGWVAAIGEALTVHDFVASRFEFEKLNTPSVRASRRNEQDEGLLPFDTPQFLPHAGGSGLGIKRSLHETVGGFDETMRSLQDTDYCWRVQLTGATLHWVPGAVIHVRFRATVRGLYAQQRNAGEYEVLLYKRYRSRGMGELSWTSGARAWLSLLGRLPRVQSKAARLRWVKLFGRRVGRLKGCVKYRVLAP